MDLRNLISKKKYKQPYDKLNLHQASMVNSEIKTRGAVWGIYKIVRIKKR